MSHFSEKLRSLIKQSGTNVYQAAKNAELDRTTMQKAVTGGRLPGLDYIKTLCAHLCVSAPDLAQLLELYEMEKIGEKTYNSRRCVKSLLEQFAQWDFIHESIPTHSVSAVVPPKNGAPIRIIKGQHAVDVYAKGFLEAAAASNAEICVSVPCNYGHFFECLRHICWGSTGQWSVRHLVPLLKSVDNGARLTENLKVLLNVLPLSFSLQQKYEAHYYYSDAGTAEDISLQMPYYFFTQHELVLLSMDFQQAVVCADPSLLVLYLENFETCLGKARSLVKALNTAIEMTQEFMVALSNRSLPICILEPQPCFACFYTPEMVDAHIRTDVENREQFLQQAVTMYQQYQATPKWISCLFSAQGIFYFAETGCLADLPRQYITPFSVPERKQLLVQMRQGVAKDALLYRAANSAKIAISSAMTVQMYSNNSLLFMAECQRAVVSCAFDEPQIGAAFRDFFDNVFDSELVLSKEETLQLLDDCILRTEQMLEQEAL